MHVSFLACEPQDYHGNGIYISDAIMMLDTCDAVGLMNKIVEVRPKSGAVPAVMGWVPDGAIECGTRCFMMSAVAMHAVVNKVTIPQPMAQALGSISATYTKRQNVQDRLCSSLIASQVHRFANSSACDVFSRSRVRQEFVRSEYGANDRQAL